MRPGVEDTGKFQDELWLQLGLGEEPNLYMPKVKGIMSKA